MNEVESELRERLHGLADPKRAALGDPAGTVLRRAHSRRRRRRIGVAALTTAAMVASVPMASGALSYLTAEPTEQATLGSETGARTDWSTIDSTGDLSELPLGAAPQVPWYSTADGAIRDGATEIPFDPGPDHEVENVIRAGDRYVVQVYGDHPERGWASELTILNADGRTHSLGLIHPNWIEPAHVSPDGTRLVWTERSAPGAEKPGTVIVSDLDSGDEVSRTPLDGSGDYLAAEGFLDDDRILVSGYGMKEGIGLLDPETGDVTEWLPAGDDADLVATLSPDRRLAAVVGAADVCGGVLTTVDRESLWDSCIFLAESFSPDGGLVVGIVGEPYTAPAGGSVDGDVDKEQSEKASSDEYRQIGVEGLGVFDAEDGTELLTLDGHHQWRRIAWEPDGDFLFEVFDGDEQAAALVRCSVSGECELAADWTDPGRYTLGEVAY